MFFGALAGGASASLGGGNFWQGAVTGLFVAGLNHVAHMPRDETLDQIARKAYGEDYKSTMHATSIQWASEMPKEGIDSQEGIIRYNPKSKYIENSAGQIKDGITVQSTAKIYISNALKPDLIAIIRTIGHEFVHTFQKFTLGAAYNNDFSEYAAHTFSALYTTFNGDAGDAAAMFEFRNKNFPKAPVTYSIHIIPNLNFLK